MSDFSTRICSKRIDRDLSQFVLRLRRRAGASVAPSTLCNMDIALLIVTAFAAAAAVASAIVAIAARADSKSAGERAQEASERAAEATERMAQIQARIFDGPPWHIKWSHDDTFFVTNESPVDACDIEVTTYPDSMSLHLDPSHEVPFRLGAKSAFPFMFSPTNDDGFRREIVLSWRRDGEGERRQWSHPIPLRPKV